MILGSAFDLAKLSGPEHEAHFDLGWIRRSTGCSERRQVVVLAIGFDSAVTSDPEELAEVRAHRRKFIAGIVARYGGMVGRVDPDLQIVAWGWPTASDADTRICVAAALEIARAPIFGAKCGIDTGIGITSENESGPSGLGFVGEMIGAAVALLERAQPGDVLVSVAMSGLVGGVFELERPAVPGAFLKALQREKPIRSVLPKCLPMVDLAGRQGEKAKIVQMWSKAVRGEAGLLLLQGEAGIGKTAMLGWIGQKVAEEAGSHIVVSCAPEVRHLPLEPVRALVEQMALLPGAAADEAASKLPSFVPPDHIEDCVARELCEACNALIADPLSPQHSIARAVIALAVRRAQHRPVLIGVEDVHLADAATLGVLEAMGELDGANIRLMVIATARIDTGSAGPAIQSGGWRKLALTRLNRRDVDLVIAANGYDRGLTHSTRLRIARLARGVPAHASELARLCVESADRDAHLRLLARPNKLNAGLTSRLDALAKLKPLAQAAAVMGRLFDSRQLALVLDIDANTLDERLALLVSMSVIAHRRRNKIGKYRFCDALLWSHAYGSMLKSSRRKLHLRIARVLEGESSSELEPAPELIAHHWKKGGEPGRAFSWWFRAGIEAAEAGRAARSVAHLNQALAAKKAAPDSCSAHDEATLLSVLGGQLRVLCGAASSETVAAYERAMQVVSGMAEKPGDLDLEIAWGLAAIHLVRGDIEAAAEASSRLFADASERGRDDFVLLALRAHGTARLLSGNVMEAVGTFKDAVRRYDRAKHGELWRRYVSDPGAVALAHLASALALAGDTNGWIDARRRALALAGEIGHVHTTANVLGVLSLSAMHLGDRAAATGLARALQHIADQQGYAYWQARSRLVLAWELGMRDPKRGLGPVFEALEAYRRTGAGRAMVFAACLAAEISIKAGEPQRASELLETVGRTGPRLGEWLYTPEVKRLQALAMIELSPQANEKAKQLLAEAEAMALEHGSMTLVERICRAAMQVDATVARSRRSRAEAGAVVSPEILKPAQ